METEKNRFAGMTFFAIYRGDEHIGNIREWSKERAVLSYLKTAGREINKKTLQLFSARVAIKGVHYE